MARDAYRFLIPLLAAAVIAGVLGKFWVLGLLAVPTGFVAWFFRDPERKVPEDPDAVVSPADGKVIEITEDESGQRIGIFLSVFDVHVNRAPWGGTILKQDYRRGRFLLAFDERASVENEQLTYTVGNGRALSFSLVAGVLARRIVAYKHRGEVIQKGDRIALIRFGSRVNVWLPSGCRSLVGKGDRVLGGETIIARWNAEGA